jgi:hypothetical protein
MRWWTDLDEGKVEKIIRQAQQHLPQDAYSEAKRPPIPIQTGHLFRSKSAGPSEANRPSSDQGF